jgi:ABC-type lipoprotein export system ATPase subunit
VIHVENITVDYGDVQPLRDVSFDISEGCVAIVGPSGVGKSTLLRVVAGLQKPSSGRVEIDGQPVLMPSRGSAGDARVGLIHQDYRLVPFLSVGENLQLAAEVRGIDLADGAIRNALTRVGLDDLPPGRRPGTLSGGEQQRVAIARLLVCRVTVVLADEPTGALDSDNTRRIAELFNDLARTPGVVVLVATHDPLVAASIEKTYELSSGQLCAR